MISIPDEYDTAIEIEFSNELSQINDKTKVNSMLQFADIYSKFVGAEETKVIFDPVKLKTYLVDSLSVDNEPLRDDKEIAEAQEQKQKELAILSAQRAGNAVGQPVLTQEQGQNLVEGMM